MKECKTCKNIVVDDTKSYCGECGFLLTKVPKCECGYDLPWYLKYCTMCGKRKEVK